MFIWPLFLSCLLEIFLCLPKTIVGAYSQSPVTTQNCSSIASRIFIEQRHKFPFGYNELPYITPKIAPFLLGWSALPPTLHILAPTWPTTPNSIKICWDIFSQIVGHTHTNRHTHTHTDRCREWPKTTYTLARWCGLITFHWVVVR